MIHKEASIAGPLFIIGVWLIYVAVSLSVFAGVVYAAVHFIKKFW